MVVEVDGETRRLLVRLLREHGFRATGVGDGGAMWEALAAGRPNLDLMLPRRPGLTLLRELRGQERWAELPVIIVTVRGQVVDRTRGLELGADDYVAKPFDRRELLARIAAALRRSAARPGRLAAPRSGVIHFSGWALDGGRRTLSSPGGAKVDLSGAKYDLLTVFHLGSLWLHGHEGVHMGFGGMDAAVSTTIMAVGVVIACAVLVRWLNGPLRRLALAGDRISRGSPVAISPDGPEEVRRLAAALEAMQARIAKLVQDRTEALAAVSHDLRTPLTRMRLRTFRPCHPVSLRRAVSNLIENATRYGGGARVRLCVESGGAVITVEDDGPGIPPEEMDRVMEPLVRLDPARASGGVGLGLAIARDAAAEQGGALTLANRPEGGSRVTLRLP